MQKISFSKKEGVNNMGYCSRSGYIKIHKFNFMKYFNSGNNIIIFFFRNNSESKTITSLTTFTDPA